MVLPTIRLAAADSNWRLFMVRKADPAFLTFQKTVHERDNHTCYYCGFRNKQELEVINLDANYRNNRLTNLVTACSFCTQCFFLEAIGKGEFGGGTLIYLPEMTQNALNALCHVLFTAIATANPDAIQARNVYRSFRLRSQVVEKQLGEGLSNPALLGQLLIDSKSKDIIAVHEALGSAVRLLPDLTRFSTEIVLWVRRGFQELLFE